MRVETEREIKTVGFWAKKTSLVVVGRNWGLTKGDHELDET